MKMQIGEIIRKYRKSKNMTQEEMASRLGVTAPAVNKWENGNSYPDVTLLAPIARLLGISTDTLLSFHEELTEEEVKQIVCEVDAKLKNEPYEEVFQWAKEKLEQYPNCEALIWQIAVILDSQRMVREIPDAEQYDEYLCSLYVRVLYSEDETLRNRAADSLFGFYMRKKQYDKAEQYLEYFSLQNPERKRKQAEIYSETNRTREAYQAYEELLFEEYQMVSGALHGMYMLAMRDNDMDKAHMLVKKQEEIAGCFEMGKYHAVSTRLELATVEKDTETVIATMQDMLSSLEQICGFCHSPLYEHMKFREPREEFLEELRNNLLDCFRDEETYGFLKHDKRWQELTHIGCSR